MSSRRHDQVPPLLEARELSLRFPGQQRPAVDRVSFSVSTGHTLGLVGASGAGKSSVARLVMGLGQVDSGLILFEGRDMAKMDTRALKACRQAMQIVFQEPSASLSPRRTVAQTLLEPLNHFNCGDAAWRQNRIGETLATVGLEADALSRYPHQFSAGQQQRIAIARALVTNPKLVIADEPVSSLDVSVQAQILQLLRKLKHEHGIAYLFVSHDLAVVRQIADEVAVMYRGQLLEQSPAGTFFTRPAHPYSRQLLKSASEVAPAESKLRLGRGTTRAGDADVCVFLHDCPERKPICQREGPGNHAFAQTTPNALTAPMAHSVKCHLYDNEGIDDH